MANAIKNVDIFLNLSPVRKEIQFFCIVRASAFNAMKLQIAASYFFHFVKADRCHFVFCSMLLIIFLLQIYPSYSFSLLPLLLGRSIPFFSKFCPPSPYLIFSSHQIFVFSKYLPPPFFFLFLCRPYFPFQAISSFGNFFYKRLLHNRKNKSCT